MGLTHLWGEYEGVGGPARCGRWRKGGRILLQKYDICMDIDATGSVEVPNGLFDLDNTGEGVTFGVLHPGGSSSPLVKVWEAPWEKLEISARPPPRSAGTRPLPFYYPWAPSCVVWGS